MAKITVKQNGPYVVEGEDVLIMDANGNRFAVTRRPFALCRCGGSNTKPFCDGTHAKIGFQAPTTASGSGGTGPKP